MCVIAPYNPAGMVSLMWCQIVKFSPGPNDMSAQSELELLQIDRLARSYGIQKLLRGREILERMQNLISPCSLQDSVLHLAQYSILNCYSLSFFH
jgi:hypothetical protein